MNDMPDNVTQAQIDEIYNAMVKGEQMETIKCSECGRVFTQGTDWGRPYGECPGCGHTNAMVIRVEFGSNELLDGSNTEGLDTDGVIQWYKAEVKSLIERAMPAADVTVISRDAQGTGIAVFVEWPDVDEADVIEVEVMQLAKDAFESIPWEQFYSKERDRMTLVDTIEVAAQNILFRYAATRGDRFRQWYYVGKNYTINPTVNPTIHDGIVHGKSAQEIADEIYAAHS